VGSRKVVHIERPVNEDEVDILPEWARKLSLLLREKEVQEAVKE